MTDYDPFAGAPASEAEKVVVTIKAGTGFESPWVVFHAKDNAEAADLLGAAEATGLFALVAQASESLRGHFNVGQGLGATPVAAPAAAQAAWGSQAAPAAPAGLPPGTVAPTCPHGTKNLVPAGISKSSGKPYSAFWGCPAPQGDSTKCRPEWVK